MTTAAWPSWITVGAQQIGYSEAPERNVAEFTPDVGPPKLRRRSSLRTDMIGFTLILLSADFEDLQEFYCGTLHDGVDYFTLTHPRNGTSGTWMFAAEPKLTQVNGLFYFVQISLRLISGGRAAPSLKFNRAPNSQYLIGAI